MLCLFYQRLKNEIRGLVTGVLGKSYMHRVLGIVVEY